MSSTDHWNCSIEHGSTLRPHRRGCNVAAGHTPNVIAIDCAECRRGYTGRSASPRRSAATRHYACSFTIEQHYPPIKGAIGGHRNGCPTQEGHSGGVAGCRGCVNLSHAAPAANPTPANERFVRHIGANNGCTEWNGLRDGKGYGIFWPVTSGPDRGYVFAHRYAWTLANGPIPEGMNVLHHCDNPSCVKTEPDEKYPEGHLFLGTHADNNRDAANKGRNAWGTRAHMAKLTEEQVREIRRLLVSETQLEIAHRFGVSQMTISKIKRAKTWSRLS